MRTIKQSRRLATAAFAGMIGVSTMFAAPTEAHAKNFWHGAHVTISHFWHQTKVNASNAPKVIVPAAVVSAAVAGCVYGVVVCSIGPAPGAVL